MEFNWIKMPNEYTLRNKTQYQQVKACVEAVNTYERVLHRELKKIAKYKAEIAMILVSDEYAEKVLRGDTNGSMGD